MRASTEYCTHWATVSYWVCPQDPREHVFDYDDPRITSFNWKNRALCPRDNRAMGHHEARVTLPCQCRKRARRKAA